MHIFEAASHPPALDVSRESRAAGWRHANPNLRLLAQERDGHHVVGQQVRLRIDPRGKGCT